jgi:hypothetical protein
VHLGIGFKDVSLNWDPRENISDLGRLAGGGVSFASPGAPRQVVLNDLNGSLRFCIAGALAEKGAFAHTLDGSYETDLRIWRTFSGLPLDLPEEEFKPVLDKALGESFGDLLVSTGQLLESMSDSIGRVARQLGESAEMLLTYTQVRGLVTAL